MSDTLPLAAKDRQTTDPVSAFDTRSRAGKLHSQDSMPPLSQRSCAQQVLAMWQQELGSRVLDFLTSDKSLACRDRLDGMLMDQRLRWQDGLECRAEVYIGVLKLAHADVSSDAIWELVSHEFELHRHFQPNTCPQFDESCRRFPEFRNRFDSQDATIAIESQRSDQFTVQLSENDPTHLVRSREYSTATVELTNRRTVTMIGEIKKDDDATVLDIGNGDGDEFISNSGAIVLPQESTSQLGACHPFDQLPQSLIRSLEEQMTSATYEVGEFIMHEGDKGDGLFLLLDGEVSIRSGDEVQSRELARASGRTMLGEMALLTDEPRTADVIATTPVTGRFLPLKVFDEMASRYPVISRVLTQLFADRLGQHGHDALAGKKLNRFVIKHRLGKGGMAIVYRGTDTSNGADVALKMMSHRLIYDHRALKLFQSEAQIIEQFDHPNIVKTVGRFRAFRSMFIAIEFCDGVSLDEVVRVKGPLKPDRFRIIFGQLASALAYAHSRKIVHRDIKPSNVIVSNNDVVKLMDFGLANPIDSMKNDGFLAGTPRYMAPEQAKCQPLTEFADVFALGCTAYRVLTGKSLIAGMSVAEAIEQHENWMLPDLSCFEDDIAEFFRQCLQIDPAQRHIDLSALATQWSRKW